MVSDEKKISATQTREGPLVFSFLSYAASPFHQKNPLHLRVACRAQPRRPRFFFPEDTRAEEHRGNLKSGSIRTLRLASAPRFLPPLSVSSSPVHLRLALSPSCYEGHQASGGAGPQEESKRASPWPPPGLPPPPPPSYRFFITYYLCLTDLLQTNGCHMEKEKQGRRKEGRKEKTLSLHPLSPCGLPEFFSSRFFFSLF